MGVQFERSAGVGEASPGILLRVPPSVVTASCSRVPFLCAVIFCRKALLERRDQRALELWLLAKS
jgi:hypothetical protein